MVGKGGRAGVGRGGGRPKELSAADGRAQKAAKPHQTHKVPRADGTQPKHESMRAPLLHTRPPPTHTNTHTATLSAHTATPTWEVRSCRWDARRTSSFRRCRLRSLRAGQRQNPYDLCITHVGVAPVQYVSTAVLLPASQRRADDPGAKAVRPACLAGRPIRQREGAVCVVACACARQPRVGHCR